MTWGIVYYATRDGRVPAEDFLDDCPAKVEARFAAVLEAVRRAPPPRQYRLFCILDNGNRGELRERGFDQPQIAAVTGMVKDSGKKFSDRDYAKVRKLGREYLAELPRRIAT